MAGVPSHERPVGLQQLYRYRDPQILPELELGDDPSGLRPVDLFERSVESLEPLLENGSRRGVRTPPDADPLVLQEGQHRAPRGSLVARGAPPELPTVSPDPVISYDGSKLLGVLNLLNHVAYVVHLEQVLDRSVLVQHGPVVEVFLEDRSHRMQVTSQRGRDVTVLLVFAPEERV
ncbi:exocyst complex component EXO70B1-like [Iris pallida]|uniref:Exocyst complex component EXO70B1-like n=1 Tax=Iris pallida TaxID=29817 RepID=A0AAX6HGU2_IRIPA|nr:exocyst complex component EXO70B1-like [Iris pallida]